MKRFKNSLIVSFVAAVAAVGVGGCHSVESWDNNHLGNFYALWTILDEHYCFFDEKNVDWQQVGERYRAEINPDWDEREFFNHCSRMLDELCDGHTNLISWFDVSYYRKWWSDYPQNYDQRLVEQYYLDFDYSSGSGFSYKYLEDRKVGYVRYSSFSYGISHSFVDMMMLTMKEADGMIIDVRDNGGGDIHNVGELVAHFIDERILGGYITHKTGPGHNDFSEPYPFYFEPIENHVKWFKPVIVLTNRSTFSAANNFVAVMKALPQVAVVGDTTGGGSGMPFSSELPCGWGVRFSASPVYDAEMRLTEQGVEPTPGGDVDLDPELALKGVDTMLEFCIEVLNKAAENTASRTSVSQIIKSYEK